MKASEITYNHRMYLLVYDIPAHSNVVNPSRKLRRLGVRINLSAWMIPENNIPWDYLEGLKAKRVDWQTIRFDDQEITKIKELARRNLSNELRKLVNGINQRIEIARKKDNCNHYVFSILRQSNRHLQDLKKITMELNLFTELAEKLRAVQNVLITEMNMARLTANSSPIALSLH